MTQVKLMLRKNIESFKKSVSKLIDFETYYQYDKEYCIEDLEKIIKTERLKGNKVIRFREKIKKRV
jgi:hypothetical protein